MFWRKKKDPAEELEAAVQKATAALGELLPHIDKLSPQEQQELKAMIAASGIAGSSLRVAQVIKKADDFGDRIHDQTMKMIDDARAMTTGKNHPPAIDPQKLMDAAMRLQETIDEANGISSAKAKARTDEALWLKNGCPATTDIKVGKPLKLKMKPTFHAGAQP